ncbi:MAG: hypothetical protein NVV74_11535 [Magnetospirillum sp.]|nr:hypothetical protein [Magnetospirillum sp.]
MGAIHDIRYERLAREAPDVPLAMGAEDQDYLLRHLHAVGEAFDVRAVPDTPLAAMSGRSLARHLARLRSWLDPQTLDQQLALGRLESVFRLVASAVRLSQLNPRRSA